MINMYFKLAIETYVSISGKLVYFSTNGLPMELQTS